MKTLFALVLFLFSSSVVKAQGDLQKLVESEHAFARTAAEKGTKSAFLEYMTDDAVVYVPDQTKAKTFWTARGEATSLLSWDPNYADISANGILGYTTGNWEFRAKGKGDTPSAFGDFITVWLRQPDGKYKWVIDIGVSHDKPLRYSAEWITTEDKAVDANEKNSSAVETSNGFFEVVAKKGLAKAYDTFASPEIRMYREGKLPILGKAAAISAIKSQSGTVAPTKRSTLFGSSNIAYTNNTYTVARDGKVVEKGNYLQLWKLRAGKWQIVLDIFKALPAQT